MRINRLKVNKLIEDIEKYLSDLDSFKPISTAKVKKDIKLQYSLAFLVEQITNECINLGNHVLSCLALRTPQKFTDIFEILCDENLISKKVMGGMVNLVRLRNIIAHRYGKITTEKLVNAVDEINVVKSFIAELVKGIEKNEK